MRLDDIPAAYFRRQDETSDAGFYAQPRLVAHIDDAAIAALGAFLSPRIPDGADALDLMSAYLTHLPPDVRDRCRRVSGLGMNEAELAANAQLTDHLVHNLNDNPPCPTPMSPLTSPSARSASSICSTRSKSSPKSDASCAPADDLSSRSPTAVSRPKRLCCGST